MLPEPGNEAKARSENLACAIREAIESAGGSIGFDDYMRLALHTPGLGYYGGGSEPFGQGGDFITAPEISPLFARCLARQCAQVLAVIPNGDILEFGAGSGALAAGLLDALEDFGQLPRRYRILELSGSLRKRQSERLARWAGCVEWLEAWPASCFRGVVLANEVLDALPVTCFMLGADGVFERRVGWSEDGFEWRAQPADEILKARIEALLQSLPASLPAGYQSEISLQLPAWLKALSEPLAQGLALLIDYGYPRREYYHPQRGSGTLLCHYRHRAYDDPFWYPGLQDISANLDFTTVAEAGEAAGFKLSGYTTQAQFLLACGIEDLYDPAADEHARLQVSQQIKRLTLPSEMGERFQVMALGKDLDLPLMGFRLRDYRWRL